MSSFFTDREQRRNDRIKGAGNLVKLWEIAEEELSDVFFGERLTVDLTDSSGTKVIIPANKRITLADLRRVLDYNGLDMDPTPQRMILMPMMEAYWERLRELKKS